VAIGKEDYMVTSRTRRAAGDERGTGKLVRRETGEEVAELRFDIRFRQTVLRSGSDIMPGHIDGAGTMTLDRDLVEVWNSPGAFAVKRDGDGEAIDVIIQNPDPTTHTYRIITSGDFRTIDPEEAPGT
jgi:hypothetical protein